MLHRFTETTLCKKKSLETITSAFPVPLPFRFFSCIRLHRFIYLPVQHSVFYNCLSQLYFRSESCQRCLRCEPTVPQTMLTTSRAEMTTIRVTIITQVDLRKITSKVMAMALATVTTASTDLQSGHHQALLRLPLLHH